MCERAAAADEVHGELHEKESGFQGPEAEVEDFGVT